MAGIDKNESIFEMEKYLKLALNELAFNIPEKRDVYISYAFILSEEVIVEGKNVVEGVSEIVQKVLFSYYFDSETKNYVYDSIFFETVYGIYNTYNDLLDAQYPGAEWAKSKSNSELLVEVEAELLNALKEWNKKIKKYVKFI